MGSEEKVGTLRKRKRKTRPLGSSQMTVLQLQQQDTEYQGLGNTQKERLGYKWNSEPEDSPVFLPRC